MRCPKCDTFEVPGGVSACVECALNEAIRQRDEARALVAVEARRADAWKVEADKRGEALEEVREAARAVLSDLDSPFCTPVRSCGISGCLLVAFWRLASSHSSTGLAVCDRHKPATGIWIESSYAPAVRRLHALLEVKP